MYLNGHHTGIPPGPATGRGVDRAALLEQFDGDYDLLREVTEVFLAHYPRLLAELKEAILWRDPERIEHAAHSLKGSIANFGARSTVDAAYRLERLGAEAQLDDVDDAFTTLQASIRELDLGLRRLATDG